MRARALALALLAAAAVVHVGVTLPARRAALAASDEYRRARDARRDVQLRLARAERRAAVLRPATASGSLVALRRDLLDASRAAGIENVKLALRPGRAPVSATFHLSGAGRFDGVVRLTDELTRPDRGIVLEAARLVAASSNVSIELDAARLGGLP